jgi:hypothetical protein
VCAEVVGCWLSPGGRRGRFQHFLKPGLPAQKGVLGVVKRSQLARFGAGCSIGDAVQTGQENRRLVAGEAAA